MELLKFDKMVSNQYFFANEICITRIFEGKLETKIKSVGSDLTASDGNKLTKTGCLSSNLT